VSNHPLLVSAGGSRIRLLEFVEAANPGRGGGLAAQEEPTEEREQFGALAGTRAVLRQPGRPPGHRPLRRL